MTQGATTRAKTQVFVVDLDNTDPTHATYKWVYLGSCPHPNQAAGIVQRALQNHIISNPQYVLTPSTKQVIKLEALSAAQLIGLALPTPPTETEATPPTATVTQYNHHGVHLSQIEYNRSNFLVLDPLDDKVIPSNFLHYHLSWYNPGRIIAVQPRTKPEIQYLVDIEANAGAMSCSCDDFIIRGDPERPNRPEYKACKHIILVQLALRYQLPLNHQAI